MDFGGVLESWFEEAVNFLPKIMAAVVIFILTLVLSAFIAKWIKKLVSKKVSDTETLQLIFRIARWTLLIFGTVVALDQVSFDVTGFVAGLGVAGFTIGFALQDMAKNFISGLLLLYRQPFSVGDTVKLLDFTGVVTDINIRDTEMRTLDGEKVIIPNQDVFENSIINYTDTKYRRREIVIGLGYEENSEKAIEIFLETLNAVPGVQKDPAPTVQADALGDSTLTLIARFWVDQDADNLLEVHSQAVQAIKIAAENTGINLPYPIQTVRLEKINQ